MITPLKVAIDKSGLKQKAIAQRAEMEPSLLSRYVTGDRECPVDVLKVIADILGVKTKDLT